MKRFLSRIPYGVYDGLSVISAIVTIITAIVGILKLSIAVNETKGRYSIDANGLFVFLSVILFALLIVLIIKIFKYISIIERHKRTVAQNFYNLTHDMRNAYFDMLNSHKQKKIVETPESLTTYTKGFLINQINNLCTILSELTGKEIHGCIKLITPCAQDISGDSVPLNRNSAEVFTFCRTSNTPAARKSADGQHYSAKISENTDFYMILDFENKETNSCFYQSDLERYDRQLQKINSGYGYQNSTKNWRTYYKSTVVAPIRVANERLFFNNLKTDYSVIGFLCVDSESTEAFRDRSLDKYIYSNIVKTFADALYIVLNMYSYYLKKVGG